jgi:hypothetical protein
MTRDSLPENHDDEPYRSPLAPSGEPVEPAQPTRRWDWTFVALVYICFLIVISVSGLNRLAERGGMRPPELLITLIIQPALFLGGIFGWFALVIGDWRSRLAALPGIFLYLIMLWPAIESYVRSMAWNLTQLFRGG